MEPYRETYKVRNYEADFNNQVKISSLFNYMQEIASNHADSLGWGFEHLEKEDLFWVLSRAKIIMNEYPPAGSNIIVETWPKNINKLFANRDFRFYDINNNIIGSATTAWLMVKRTSLRPVRPEILLTYLPVFDAIPGIDEILEKLPEAEEKIFLHQIETGYNDIDINRHTNNARYVEYILDCFSDNFFIENKIKAVQVNFLNQTKAGDKLSLYEGYNPAKKDERYIEAINHLNQPVFQSAVEFEKINF